MEDDSSGKALVRKNNKNIVRYSNTLVRRGLLKLVLQSPELVRSTLPLKDVLIIESFYEDSEMKLGRLLSFILQYMGIEADLAESYRHADNMPSELSCNEYNVIILQGRLTFELIPTIKEKYPRTRILGMSGGPYHDHDDIRKTLGLDSFLLKGPTSDIDNFVSKVKELLPFPKSQIR